MYFHGASGRIYDICILVMDPDRAGRAAESFRKYHQLLNRVKPSRFVRSLRD
jgi:hypothetical protein